MIAAIVLAAAAATAGVTSAAPPAVQGVGLDEHVGAELPRDARFTDTTGKAVELGDLLGDGRPALLVMAYARCTMLCSVILRGVAEAVRASPLVPGKDFHLIVVSLDPRETVDEASRKQAVLLEEIGRTGDRGAWPYLVGTPTEVARLAKAIGFRYAWDARTQQYAHPAVVFAITPDAHVAEYVRGVRFPDGVLDAAVRRAAAGLLTPSATQDLLTCFHFDPSLRRYQARIQTYFRIGAGVIFGALITLVLSLLLWERRRGRP